MIYREVISFIEVINLILDHVSRGMYQLEYDVIYVVFLILHILSITQNVLLTLSSYTY